MQPTKFSFCGLSFVVLVCWLGINDAIPFGPNADGAVRSPTSRHSKAWKLAKKTVPVTGQPESLQPKDKKSSDTRRSNHNNNINANTFYPGVIRPASKQRKGSPKSHISDNNDTLTDHGKVSAKNGKEWRRMSNSNFDDSDLKPEIKKIIENIQKTEEMPEKCPIDARRSSQAYTQSLPFNASSIDLVDAFKVIDQGDPKKTSSVHIGEDITLCWIETTTVKQNPAFDPPKRLVIREFTLSFENSATIPESYLDCTKLDGEIAPGDEETVCKTSLHEVIDENTRRSRVVNFTSDSRAGSILVYQQKTIRCAMGGVVYKDIYEWPDGSDSPRKRVEIKLGPSIRDLGEGSDKEHGGCKTGVVARETKEDHGSSSVSNCTSGESCETPVTCNDGEECNEPSTASLCEDDICSTGSLSEETLSTTYPLDTHKLTVNEVTEITTTEKTQESSTPLSLLTSLPHNSHRADDDPCPKYDTDCEFDKTTMEPGNNEIEICSGEDCSRGSSDGSASEASVDESIGTSKLCSGEDCPSKEEDSTAGPKEIIAEGNESCQEGSESCIVHSSEKSDTLATGNKLIDKKTAPAVNQTDKLTLNDFECDSESADCSGSSETSSYEEGKTNTTTSDQDNSETSEHSSKDEEETTSTNFDVEFATHRPGETELPGTIDSTEVLPSSEVASTMATLRPCQGSESKECATVEPASGGFSEELSTGAEELSTGTEELSTGREELSTGTEELSTGTEEYLSTSEGTEISVTAKEDSEISRTESTNDERSSSCGEDSADENCQSIGSSSELETKDDHLTTDSSPKVIDLEDIISSTSEEHKQRTNPGNNAVTSIPIMDLDSDIPMIEASTELPGTIKNSTLSDDEPSSGKDSMMECIPNSKEGSTACGEKQTGEFSVGSEETTVSSESCESSGTCASMEESLSSTETKQPTSKNSTANVENRENTDCDNNSTSCEVSSSGTSSETCEEGSSSEECTSNDSTEASCDSSSGSCSSGESSSTGLTDGTIDITTESTAKELEQFSTTIDNILTTAETRRSTAPSLSLNSAPTKERHKLALRIKVLLEQINENKEKEQLVQIEKHLLLNERPEELGNHSLVWQIKSLNNSMNMETFRSIFNCTSLENFTEEFSNLTEFKRKSEEEKSLQNEIKNSSVEKSATEAEDETQNNSVEGSNESPVRKKREILVSESNVEKKKNVTDSTKAEAIKESLPGVNEDFQKGLNHVLSRISQELEGPATSSVSKPVESSSSKILKILADPTDSRVHSERRKRASKAEVVTVEELDHPVNGEEIDRWSNERFVKAADGGQVRSLLEFKIMRDPGEDSRRISSGS